LLDLNGKLYIPAVCQISGNGRLWPTPEVHLALEDFAKGREVPYLAVPGILRLASTVSGSSHLLGPVNTSMIAALLPEIRPGKARGGKFGYSK